MGGAFPVLVDFPDTAGFLTPEERDYVIRRKKYDNSGVGEEERFSVKYIIQAFTDWQVYALALVDLALGCPLYSITLFLPTIIKEQVSSFWIPFHHKQPSYGSSIYRRHYDAGTTAITLCTFAYLSDKTKLRSPFLFASFVLTFIGFTIIISSSSSGVKYFATFLCVMGTYSGIPGVVAWLGNNLAGQYKRAVGMAFQVGLANVSGVVASNVYHGDDGDGSGFALGHGISLMFIGIGLITVPIVTLAYHRANGRKERVIREEEERGVKRSAEEIRAMGDRAPEFRYTL
ncbi:hypothetical protein PQX77_019905 [Marasmius sp. AFHP31]|nr:hypothetical protein PQX77_019905 [Marasmius sp. AFHP31]